MTTSGERETEFAAPHGSPFCDRCQRWALKGDSGDGFKGIGCYGGVVEIAAGPADGDGWRPGVFWFCGRAFAVSVRPKITKYRHSF